MIRAITKPMLVAATLLESAGCEDETTMEPPTSEVELAVGETRTVELRFLRFEVDGAKQSLSLTDLRNLPGTTLEEQWLLDLDMTPLVENVLKKVIYMPPQEAYALPKPAHHLWKLLNMTPESADLSGTSLEGLLGVGKAIGLPPSEILADMIDIGPNDPIVPVDVAAQVVLEQVIATHPNTRVRTGPKTPEHPDGIYPVAPHSIPVTLADVANGFAGLAERYGPTSMHPGFLKEAKDVRVAGDDFRMTVKVDLNALPYKGIDASIAAEASVNSVGSQIDTIFDFSDPEWLEIEGLVEPSIGELVMVIEENDMFAPGGDARDPAPTGNSPVWATPPWQFEHVLASAGMRRAARIPAHCTAYAPQGNVEDPFDAVDVCIDETGWTEIAVDPAVVLDGPPPQPSYFWDLLLEVAQVRLHDGGIPEGAADIELRVEDVSIGMSSQALLAQIRTNLEADPRALRGIAEALTDSTVGDADFYYVRPTEAAGDWLYFVSTADIRTDEDGVPVRSYDYATPGFYADPALTQKISSQQPLDGDLDHEKVQIEPGMTLYIEDDQARRFEIRVADKPNKHRISLEVERIR